MPNKCLQHGSLDPAHPLCSVIHQTATSPGEWTLGEVTLGGGSYRGLMGGSWGSSCWVGLGQTRTSTLALQKAPGEWLLAWVGSPASGGGGVCSLCPSPELHRAGRITIIWRVKKKKKSLSNNYSLRKLAGGTQNAAWIALWPPPLQARRAVAKNGRKNICNAFK